MPDLTSIIMAIDFVEAHLKEPVSVVEIAEAASYSVYHFCRVFNRLTHHSPYDYLMRRRLAESARELIQTKRRIIDVALDYQFGSPEAYSRAFKRVFELQPRQWRQRGFMDARSVMPPLTLAHLEHRNGARRVRPTLERRGEMLVSGVVTLVSGKRRPFARLWTLLAHELDRKGLDGLLSYVGIASYPVNWEEHGFFYMVGIESDSHVHGSSLVTKSVPPSEYACFSFSGAYANIGFALDYGYHTWLPRSGHSLAHPLEIEVFGETQPGVGSEPRDMDILIPVA